MKLIDANAAFITFLAGAWTVKGTDLFLGDNVARDLSTMMDFSPLTCNEALSEVDCANGQAATLSSILDSTPADAEAHIPCGTCVVLDTTDGSTVYLPNGLNVEGMLYIPSTVDVVLEATHIFIQGVWKIDPPDFGNTITVRMVGTENEWLLPHEENAHACNAITGCSIGKKAIVVAGGRLDINGLSDPTCPAFTKLQFYQEEYQSRPGCPGEYDLLMGDGTFDSGTDGFGKHHGGQFEILVEDDGNAYLSQSQRCCSFTGLNTKLNLACAEESVEYEYSIRYRTRNPSNVAEANGPPAFQIQPQDGSSGCNSCRNIPNTNCPTAIDDEWVICTFTLTLNENERPPISQTANFVMGPGLHSSKIIEYDDISFKVLPTVYRIVVDTKAAECWGARVRDKILITNSKAAGGWDDQAALTIESVDVGTGTLTIPRMTSRPTMVEVDPVMASEVAWLSRSIVFDAVEDDELSDSLGPLHGGHLIVLHTPNVAQRLEGVEIRNFGQQGNLGRYPIHFHMSGNVAGSVVRKNVILNSNQRCVVIHGSNEVMVEDNVAFDTYGHCYLLEDGAEMENTFQGNLGARTRNQHNSIGSSDNEASTFWITNTKNHFIGNVAAGSQKNGYWFELREVRGASAGLPQNEDLDPNSLPLYTFRDNTAHSNVDGLRTYFPGWRCPSEAVFESVKIYQNRGLGLFIHGTQNVKVKNGFFAENSQSILYFGNFGTNIVEDSLFIGVPDRLLESSCSANRIGITFSLESVQSQIEVRNTSFKGFSAIPLGCERSGVALRVSSAQPKPIYDMPVLKDLTFDVNTGDAVDIASPFLNENIFIEDPNGTMNPSGNHGFYVNNVQHMTPFMEEACSPIARDGSHALFCEDVCLRRIRVDTGCCEKKGGTPDIDYKMIITSKSDPTIKYIYTKKVETSGLWVNTRNFDLVLPFDTYTVNYESVTTGEIDYPEVTWNFGLAPQCNTYVTEESFNSSQVSPIAPPTVPPQASSTASPQASATTSPQTPQNPTVCTENENDRFLVKVKKDGSVTTRTCSWLSQQLKKKQKKYCLKRVSMSSDFSAPQYICQASCDSCDPCYENPKSRFFQKKTENGTSKFKNCSWLQKKKPKARYKVCKNFIDTDSGYGPPADVCPKTCDELLVCT